MPTDINAHFKELLASWRPVSRSAPLSEFIDAHAFPTRPVGQAFVLSLLARTHAHQGKVAAGLLGLPSDWRGDIRAPLSLDGAINDLQVIRFKPGYSIQSRHWRLSLQHQVNRVFLRQRALTRFVRRFHAVSGRRVALALALTVGEVLRQSGLRLSVLPLNNLMGLAYINGVASRSR